VTSNFADLGVPANLCALLARRGMAEPFPIQAATLPDALAGRDVCGRAPTGSGKTLAFGLAIAARVGPARPRRPRALVLVPTRELAAQVAGEIEALLPASSGLGTGDPSAAVTPTASHGAPSDRDGRPEARKGRKGRGGKGRGGKGRDDHAGHVLAVYGGASYGPQRRGLARGAAVVVACPGRLEDLLAQGDVELDDVDLVVLDEADRMADMGFLPAVRRLLDRTNPERQVLLFSATLDHDVDALVRRYQRDPARHDATPTEDDRGDVAHLFWRTDRAARADVVAGLVLRHGRAIVFSRTRRGADRLARRLAATGVEAVAIHGDRSQGQRERALAAFARGRVQALVATDVAARGIHVDDVACVVHYDLPGDHKDYVHRSGRTGRAGASGTVVSLVLDDDRRSVRALQRTLGLPERLDAPDVPAVVTGLTRPPRSGDRAGAAAASATLPAHGRRPDGRGRQDDTGTRRRPGGDGGPSGRGRDERRTEREATGETEARGASRGGRPNGRRGDPRGAGPRRDAASRRGGRPTGRGTAAHGRRHTGRGRPGASAPARRS
jgi:superfamily II DNA/RNA helicase